MDILDYGSFPEGCKKQPVNRLRLTTIPIQTETLSKGGSKWLHAVEALKEKKQGGTHFVKIRVITNQIRGVNILIPHVNEELNKELYSRYLHLRFLIRNTDTVLVNFPVIYVLGSIERRHELYLMAYDFKIFDPDKDSEMPPPKIEV